MTELLARAYSYVDVRARVEPSPARPAFELQAASGVPDSVLELARSQARASGYAAGWAQGLQEAREQMAADVASSQQRLDALDVERSAGLARALAALDEAAADLEARAVPSVERLEDVVVEMALTIASALVGHELLASTSVGADALARALRLSPDNEPVTVELSPSDHATLVASDLTALVGQRTVTLVASAPLAPGDAVAICGATRIDARIAAGLDRVKDALIR